MGRMTSTIIRFRNVLKGKCGTKSVLMISDVLFNGAVSRPCYRTSRDLRNVCEFVSSTFVNSSQEIDSKNDAKYLFFFSA